MTEKLLLRPTEAAERLSIGRSAMYLMLQRGIIKPVRVGRSLRVRPEDLARYVERLAGDDA